ncbi:MAG: terminase large subunit [Alsobacter sp.]
MSAPGPAPADKLDPKRWRQPGAEGFRNFLDDVQPVIKSDTGSLTPYRIPNPEVDAEIERGLAPGIHTWVVSFPRRHGKTALAAAVILHRFLSQTGQAMAISANAEAQGADTTYKILKTMVERTPLTAGMVRKKQITVTDNFIRYERAGNDIQLITNNAASAHGKKLSLASIGELHAARGDEVYQTLSAATIDSANGLTIVDSTVSGRDGPLWRLWQLHLTGADPSLHFSHLAYADLEDAIRRGPPWIKPERLRSRAAQLLPQQFALEHLNQWQAASSSAFTDEMIEGCRDPGSPRDVAALADGRAVAVGAGLDRAMAFSLHGDRTVLTTVAKLISDADEMPHYHVLDVHTFRVAIDRAIKAKLTAAKREFGIERMVVETYQGQDIAHFAQGMGIETELQHAGRTAQAAAFTELITAANEGRLHIPPEFAVLFDEMRDFRVELKASGTTGGLQPVFGHAKGKHDDALYSLAWAIHSLRDTHLPNWEMASVECRNPKPSRHFCVLNGGRDRPLCASECPSWQALERMHDSYRKRAAVDPLPIDEFAAYRVVNKGVRVVPR